MCIDDKIYNCFSNVPGEYSAPRMNDQEAVLSDCIQMNSSISWASKQTGPVLLNNQAQHNSVYVRIQKIPDYKTIATPRPTTE